MNYLKYTFTIFGIMLMAVTTLAQKKDSDEKADEDDGQMVQNGSFELAETKSLKKFEMLENAEDWTSATYTKADLFSESAKGELVSAPKNAYGTQEAVDGGNYAGFRAYTKDKKKMRTYLSARLTDQMEKDKQYCITINVSLADLSKYAVNSIGVLVTKNKTQKGDTKSIIDPNFQIKTKLNKVIEDREGWVTICGTYTAKGGEGAIVIGCFDTNDNLQVNKMKKPSGVTGIQTLDAYYYVDNVSVVEVEARSQCNCGDEIVKEEVIYSPSYVDFAELTDEEKVAASTVYFAQQTAKISSVAKRDLNRFIEFLKENPNVKLKVAGHMDLDEFDESKIKAKLSNIGEQRAQAVVDYMISKGLDASRFIVQDKAASSPLSKYKTPMSLAKNRRVEFILM